MILLEYHNKIIEDTLLDKFNNPPGPDGKWESFNALIADFDGVTFQMATDPNSKNLFKVSISIKCFGELRYAVLLPVQKKIFYICTHHLFCYLCSDHFASRKYQSNFTDSFCRAIVDRIYRKHGVDDVLKQQYGDLLVTPENGYDVTLQVDLASPPAEKEKLARNVALLKRHCLSAPFYKVFNDIESKKPPGAMIELPYRDEEAIYLKPEADRCIIIFSIQFKDADDVVFAKVFLQEYQDARRTMSNAPSVSYSQKEPPLELKGVKNLKVGENNGFVSFGTHILPTFFLLS